jgi:PAS domain S-box-containing protein
MPTPAPSGRPQSQVILNYGIAVLAAMATIAVEIAFNRFWGINPSVSLLLCAIMFVAWISGTGPALLTTALMVLAFDYLLLEPIYSLALDAKEVPRFALFAVASLFIVWLSAVQQRTAASLRRARDEQQETVKELQVLNETLRIENAERRRAEDALRESEAELAKARYEGQLIIDTVPVLILRHRADGVIDFVNQVGRSYSGLTATNWTRRTSAITHPDDIPQIEAMWDVALVTGEPFETEARLRRADGEYRWFATRRVPLRNDDGEVIAWYAASYDIEDRKRAEDALREREAQLAEARRELELTIDSIPVMVSTFDADGTRSFVNQTWQNYTGHTGREATGKGLNSSVYYHPDDVRRFENAWRVSQAKGEMLSIDVRTRRADGVYRWYTMRRAPRRDEKGNIVKWYSVGVDVEDQKAAENALRRSETQLANAERELRLTLDSIPALVWRAGLEGSPDFLNQPALDYTGLSLDQAETGWPRAFHPDDRKGMLVKWTAIRASGMPGGLEARLRRFDGEYRWFSFQAVPLRDESGNIVKWYGSSTDIEERKRAESALHDARTALAHASRVTMLGEISATIAHEVNQPLAAIITNGQACLRFLRHETPDLEDVRGALEWIVKDGNRASGIIQRVRGLLKNTGIQKTPLDVNDVIGEVAALLQRELDAQDVILRLELAPALPPAIADRVQIQQVIINLMMNGVDALQAINDRPRGLLVRSSRNEAGQVVVAVKDSGVGISLENASRVFDPFFSTKPGGLGIGLSICRSIIEDHGGRLWTSDDRDGPGATFQFSLPTQRADVH